MLHAVVVCVALLGVAAGFSFGPGRVVRGSSLAAEPVLIEACQKRHCKRRGAAGTMKLLQELAPEGVEVVPSDMSHTEHGCFDLCAMGPNVRLGGALRTDEGDVTSGVKGIAAVCKVLGIDEPPPTEDG